MDLFGDFQETQEKLIGAWSEIRADLLSHVFAIVGLIFFGVTVPIIDFDPKQFEVILDSPAYKIAKDAGFVVLVGLLLFIILLIYRMLLRSVGELLIKLQGVILLPPNAPPPNNPRINAYFTRIASTLVIQDFTMLDLYAQAVVLLKKNSSELQAIYKTTPLSDTRVYLRNASVFVVLWIFVFSLLPDDSDWVVGNSDKFWNVLFLLVFFLGWAWVRFLRFQKIEFQLLLGFISDRIRIEKGQEYLKWRREHFEKAYKHVCELRTEEKEWLPQTPSKLIIERWKNLRKSSQKKSRGRPLTKVYKRGLEFGKVPQHSSMPLKDWLIGILCFSYYSIHLRLIVRAKSLWRMLVIWFLGPK